jgi:hypothetical protein
MVSKPKQLKKRYGAKRESSRQFWEPSLLMRVVLLSVRAHGSMGAGVHSYLRRLRRLCGR